MSIVVGVDGSEASKAALRWALEEARIRSTSVDAVYAWPFPYGALGFGWSPTIDKDAIDDARRAAEIGLHALVQDAAADAGGVEIQEHAIEGAPGSVLLEKAEGAEMLVVGSCGLGGFKELMLGSVSHQCAQHASCPVVIVRQHDVDGGRSAP